MKNESVSVLGRDNGEWVLVSAPSCKYLRVHAASPIITLEVGGVTD